MSNDTVLRLAQVPGIIGIKDATGDIGRGALLVRDVPAGFQVFSGDDATAAALILLGGSGNRSEEHTSELKSLMRISKDVFGFTKKKPHKQIPRINITDNILNTD